MAEDRGAEPKRAPRRSSSSPSQESSSSAAPADRERWGHVRAPAQRRRGRGVPFHTGVTHASKVPDAIEFIDVHKSFGRNQVLRGLNLELPEGRISMILGPSGTGKSVCIKHIVGLLYPDEGDVIVHGQSMPSLSDDDLFETRKKFGVLFQDGALFGSMNLYDNVAFPLRQHTEKGEEEIAEIVNRRLREVGLGGEGRRCPTSSPAGCASAPGSRARSCSTPTSCCSTSPTRASIRCAPRCCAS